MVQIISVALITVAMAAANIQARNIRLYNACPFTVWGAHATGGTDPGRAKPAGDAGYEVASYQSHDIAAPETWISGRIWARTSCDFSKPETQECVTGSCKGGLNCNGDDGGIPPVTVAEFSLFPPNDPMGRIDNYDISNVDGSNLPMTITADNVDCESASCPVDLNANCPGELQVKDGSGNVQGCRSACQAKGGESNCCTGAHDKAETCPPSGVEYYDYFNGNCPQAYAYAYDEKAGVLKTCDKQPNYTITLCPPPA